jgi:hypothetical protein
MQAVPAPFAQPAASAEASAETPVCAMPWLYRSEGFAEDLDDGTGEQHGRGPGQEPALLRWGLPLLSLVLVVGMAAAFSLA